MRSPQVRQPVLNMTTGNGERKTLGCARAGSSTWHHLGASPAQPSPAGLRSRCRHISAGPVVIPGPRQAKPQEPTSLGRSSNKETKRQAGRRERQPPPSRVIDSPAMPQAALGLAAVPPLPISVQVLRPGSFPPLWPAQAPISSPACGRKHLGIMASYVIGATGLAPSVDSSFPPAAARLC